MDSWYEDPDRVRVSIGMPAADSLLSTPGVEVCLPVLAIVLMVGE